MNVKAHYCGNNTFEIRKITSPGLPRPNQVIVSPLRVGICGSDLFHMEENSEEIEVGHEWVGRVQAIGSEIKRLKVGDIVTSSAFLSCGECHQCQKGESNYCLNGIMLGSEEKSVLQSWETFSENDLITLPPNIPVDHAPLLEVAAIGDEAIAKLRELNPNPSSVLVFGGGPIGTFTALSLKRSGVTPFVVDKNPERLQIAENLGLQTYHFGALLIKKDFFNSFSNVIDCSGESPQSKGAFEFIPRFIGPKAHVVIVGKYHSVSPKVFSDFSELTPYITWMRGVSKKAFLKTIRNWERDIENYTELMNIQVFTLSRINEAFEFARSRPNCLKTIISLNS